MHPAISSKQQSALNYAANISATLAHEALPVLNAVCSRNDISSQQVRLAIKGIQDSAHVAIHFHPDRLNNQHKTVAESLLQQGYIKNQFETGLSNGALTPFTGGIRDNWEQQLFGGVYQQQDADITERPKYGALDLVAHPDGPAPRFGSCYFRLAPPISAFCSFSEKDSYYHPVIYGTANHFEAILAELLTRVEQGQEVLGLSGLTAAGFLDKIIDLSSAGVNYSAGPGRTLDDYIEAQIHCTIDLHSHVTTLVADPSFSNTTTGHQLEAICNKYNIDLLWHQGSRVKPANILPDFRGIRVVQLAYRIQENGYVTAEIIGRAARSLQLQPILWQDWGSIDDTLQQLKQLWHAVVQFGTPITHQ